MGNLLGDYFAFHQLNSYVWYYYVANALFVFIPGLALAIMHSRSNRSVTIPAVLIVLTIGNVISTLVIIIGDNASFHIAGSDWIGAFFGDALLGVVCLISVPIVLVVYHAISKRRQSA